MPPALNASTSMISIPDTNVVPEMTPVAALMRNPLGSTTAAKLVGWLVAVIW